jgi:hypothetical protein
VIVAVYRSLSLLNIFQELTMNETDRFPAQAPGGTKPGTIGDRPRDRVEPATSSISSAASEASDAVVSEAQALGVQAQQVAEDQAEKVKEATATHMDGFADALRAASDELSNNQSGPAAEFVANAASGLEDLSRSLHGKTTGEMIESVRRFGRDNPMGFLAGSVLAGLALGRFAAAGTPSSGPADRSAKQRPAVDSLGGNRSGMGGSNS